MKAKKRLAYADDIITLHTGENPKESSEKAKAGYINLGERLESAVPFSPENTEVQHLFRRQFSRPELDLQNAKPAGSNQSTR